MTWTRLRTWIGMHPVLALNGGAVVLLACSQAVLMLWLVGPHIYFPLLNEFGYLLAAGFLLLMWPWSAYVLYLGLYAGLDLYPVHKSILWMPALMLLGLMATAALQNGFVALLFVLAPAALVFAHMLGWRLARTIVFIRKRRGTWVTTTPVEIPPPLPDLPPEDEP